MELLYKLEYEMEVNKQYSQDRSVVKAYITVSISICLEQVSA